MITYDYICSTVQFDTSVHTMFIVSEVRGVGEDLVAHLEAILAPYVTSS